MTQEEHEAFMLVVFQLQESYPTSEIQYTPGGMCSAIVYNRDNGLHNREAFNTNGYNLLYCITNLSRLLKEKLR